MQILITYKQLLRAALSFALIVSGEICRSQSSPALSIDECYDHARTNYPMIKQMDLISRSGEYSIDNAAKGYLPQIAINGQAHYQSAVTTFPGNSPSSDIPTLSKDQYKIYAEINQPLTDFYTIRNQKEWIKANVAVEEQNLEVELYKVKERINQVFFGILLIDAQLAQTNLLREDIESAIKKTEASIANGTALKSSLQVLQAERLKVDQSITSLKANRRGFTEMLALFTNLPLDDSTKLLTPPVLTPMQTISRPELRLFDAQQKSLTAQDRLITARNIPHVNLFLQGGYGRPTLDFLSNDFDFYYLGGIRLTWNLAGLYTSANDRQLLQLNQRTLDVRRETFLFNTNLSMRQQSNEIGKMQELVKSDDEIIALRRQIKLTSGIQLDNGTITTTDYLVDVNAEDQAIQNQLVHQVQLKLAQYNYQSTSGNL